MGWWVHYNMWLSRNTVKCHKLRPRTEAGKESQTWRKSHISSLIYKWQKTNSEMGSHSFARARTHTLYTNLRSDPAFGAAGKGSRLFFGLSWKSIQDEALVAAELGPRVPWRPMGTSARQPCRPTWIRSEMRAFSLGNMQAGQRLRSHRQHLRGAPGNKQFCLYARPEFLS